MVASIVGLALSGPVALLAWVGVSAAAISLVRTDLVTSAAIALVGASVIGLSRVFSASGMRRGGRQRRGEPKGGAGDSTTVGQATAPNASGVSKSILKASQEAGGDSLKVVKNSQETIGDSQNLLHVTPNTAGDSQSVLKASKDATADTQNVVSSAGRWLDRNELLLLIAASPFFLFPLRPFTPVVVLVPLLWLGRWLARGYVTRRSPLNLPVLCLLAMLIPSTIAAADPELSLAKLIGLVFGVGLYAAILNAQGRDTAAKTADALVWVALVAALVSLLGTDWPAVGKLSIYDRIYQLLPRLISELPRSISATGLINPNEVGGVLAWTLPFVIGLWLAGQRVKGRRSIASAIVWQLGLGLTMALNAGTLLLTQSRSAIGGVTLALLALIGVFQVWFRVALIVGALGAAYYAYTLGPERVSDLILRAGDERLSSVPDLTLSGRLTIWEEGLALVRQQAWTGTGLGNFDLVRSDVGVESSPELQKRLVIHAHNEFLQAAVDLGVPGLVAFTALLACAFGCLWGLSQHAKERVVRGLAGAILAGLLAHQIFGLVDAIALGAKTGFVFWVLLGLTGRLWVDEREERRT